MKSLYAKFLHILDSEHDRYILWVPVCMAYGIAWYFSLKSEPLLWSGAIAFVIASLAAWLLRRIQFLLFVFLAAAFVAAGFFSAALRTHNIHSPFLTAPVSFADVTGKIVEIAPTPKGSKILLKEVTVSKIAPEDTPKYVSITLRTYNPSLVTGQIISTRAGLFPPPDPALPGGFDFSRYFYFRETGAVGYGIPPTYCKVLKGLRRERF